MKVIDAIEVAFIKFLREIVLVQIKVFLMLSFISKFKFIFLLFIVALYGCTSRTPAEINSVYRLGDEQLIYEIFYNAKLQNVNDRTNNKIFYDAIINEMARRNYTSFKQIEYWKKRGRANYQPYLGLTLDEIIQKIGEPDRRSQSNGKIESITYITQFYFTSKVTFETIKHFEAIKFCFENEMIVEKTYVYEIGNSWGGGKSMTCPI